MIKTNKAQPRFGMKGKKHTEASKEKMRNNHYNCKGRNNSMYGKIAKHGKGSYYKNIWMRSSYEIKYAQYLDSKNIKWLYESKTFDLGNSTYTPDFYLQETDEYIEIKGWWRDDAKLKFRLFKQKYPNIKIEVIYGRQ
jgi:predicted nuclease of restriction endonuclease-like RecB superfamily